MDRPCLRAASLLICLFLLLPLAGMPARAQGQRLVLAFYYAWYDEETWGVDKVPDMPLSPYRSADRATIERHVQEARSAGIDALVQSWYGPGTNQTETNFATLLDVAQAHGMQATVDFETTSPYMPDLHSAIDGLSHLIGVHAWHPAFLRYEGKPAIFFWQQGYYSLETWAAVRAQVDPGYETLWIAEGDDPAWLSVFDGLHLYTITWQVNTNPTYTATKMRKRVDEHNAAHATHKLWVATAMPGYDDTHIEGRAHPYAYPRSPEYYRSTWEAAMASAPEMVIVTSFNEWREGTMIEPSVTYGRTYLDLTAELAAQYKCSSAPTPTPATPTATPAIVPTPTATFTLAPTATPSQTPTGTPTATPSPQPTATTTPTPSPTATATATASPTHTSTPVASPTQTSTASPTATRTFAGTATYSYNETVSPTASTPVPPSGRPCFGASALVAGAAGFVLSRRGRRSTKAMHPDGLIRLGRRKD